MPAACKNNKQTKQFYVIEATWL